MMIYVKCITSNNILIIITKLKLKSVQIILKMEVTEGSGIGPVTVVIASLGEMYQLTAP